jgi:hypothetical protein
VTGREHGQGTDHPTEHAGWVQITLPYGLTRRLFEAARGGADETTEVQEVVGSGHDEQTEDPDPESKLWSQGFDAAVLAVLVWLTHQAEVSPPHEALALLNLRDSISKHFEERFKPSGPERGGQQ